jgi:cytoskeletal protein CcmA (bactofilin family)
MPKSISLSAPGGGKELTGVIDKGSEFEGTLSFEGTFRIGGVFRGYIFTNDILIIGEGARVEAEVEAGTLVINGEFTGNIRAKNRVEIHRPAVFRGNIQTPSLMVDEGVVFEGTSQMTREEDGPRPSDRVV